MCPKVLIYPRFFVFLKARSLQLAIFFESFKLFLRGVFGGEERFFSLFL
jgi:hypothetical protein